MSPKWISAIGSVVSALAAAGTLIFNIVKWATNSKPRHKKK